jgi:hypothetical protein
MRMKRSEKKNNELICANDKSRKQIPAKVSLHSAISFRVLCQDFIGTTG